MAVVAGIARAAFNAALPSFVRGGLSANAAIREFKSMGMKTFRRKDMLAMFRQQTGIAKMENVVKFIRKEFLPSKDVMVVASTPMKREYLYKMELDVYDDDGNFLETKYTSLMNDELMTPSDLEDAAQDAMQEGIYVIEDMHYENPRLVGLFRSSE